MELIDIIKGHTDELLGKNESLSEQRLAICKKCPLYKKTRFGLICNPSLYISSEDKETISTTPKIGYKKGCGCRLEAKTRLPHAKCIVNKW